MTDIFILIHRHKERIYVAARGADSRHTISFGTSCNITKNTTAKQYIPKSDLAVSSINLMLDDSPLSFEHYFCHDHIPNWYSIIDTPKDKNLVDVCFFEDLDEEDTTPTVAAVLMLYIINRCKSLLQPPGSGQPACSVWLSTSSSDNMQTYNHRISGLVDSNLVPNISPGGVNVIPLSEFVSLNVKRGTHDHSEGLAFLITDEDVGLFFNENKGVVFRGVYKHRLLDELQGIIRAKIGFLNMNFSDATLNSVIETAQLDFLPTLSSVDFSSEITQLYKKVSVSIANHLLPLCLESELFFKNITILQMGGIARHLADSFASEIDGRRAALLACDKAKLPELSIITYTPQQTAVKLLEFVATPPDPNSHEDE